jgi:16S rRNA processing protein RimM
MISKADILEIGSFQKTHGLAGELNALLDVEEDYVDAGHPFIMVVEGIPVPFYPESIRTKGKKSYLVKLDGIDNQNEAQAFVNKAIYGLRSDLIDYFDTDEEGLMTESELIGATVIDKQFGEIGTLIDVDTSTQNTLLVVEKEDGSELYIPYVEEFVEDYDAKDNIFHVSIPDGLLNINAKSNDDE